MQGFAASRQVKLRFFAAAAFACLLVPMARAQAAPGSTPLGWWLEQTGRAGILIAPCGAQLCGHIEWLNQPLTPQGQVKTDIHNPDSGLHGRPICGLPVIWGFVPDNGGGWSGGWIYDPDAGKTYKSVMHVQADGSLRVRGYIGIPLIGRSEVWTRPPAPLTPCNGAK